MVQVEATAFLEQTHLMVVVAVVQVVVMVSQVVLAVVVHTQAQVEQATHQALLLRKEIMVEAAELQEMALVVVAEHLQ
jgi:hypothetical protein